MWQRLIDAYDTFRDYALLLAVAFVLLGVVTVLMHAAGF